MLLEGIIPFIQFFPKGGTLHTIAQHKNQEVDTIKIHWYGAVFYQFCWPHYAFDCASLAPPSVLGSINGCFLILTI